MGLCISMCSSSSGGKQNSKTHDISTYNIHTTPPNSIQISRQQSPPQMSSHTSRRTEISSTGVNSRSTADLLEEVSRLLTTLPQRH
ncbi:AC4 [Sweet potato leaf curl Canary virus]|uniref:AC4 n=1 Tax=Sweet potato leaf curl Canary virus TaxID=652718 RepID=A0A1B1PIS8_9GEMI|nr:AC4 [Sweet potato leaf curl Canary virus]ANT48198.1 AC4 [Sweet potato leaf curl Canary virus]ANT48228.1 AC4 [Sweet potato leaf curl Canary virus]QCT23859.1 AC4 [Sweet potato leaf curl Canary virus]QCT23865.1 AC4 [Sweet potato leaf curl Canary virus]